MMLAASVKGCGVSCRRSAGNGKPPTVPVEKGDMLRDGLWVNPPGDSMRLEQTARGNMRAWMDGTAGGWKYAKIGEVIPAYV